MRLFFGFEIHAPWPEVLPPGRHLAPEARHITLAFLGEVDKESLLPYLDTIPKPPQEIGWQGHFSQTEFYPPRHPHVAAWGMQWHAKEDELHHYQKQLSAWLKELGFILKEGHPFNPHVTLCRSPFDQKEWREAFEPLPFYTGALNLYQSLGNSNYKSLWKIPVHPPFIEIEHTADIAYHIFGETEKDLFHSARLALSFKVPSLVNEPLPLFPVDTLDQAIKGLNWQIAQLDQKQFTPFKAVSYHGQVEKKGLLTMWEMIVDV